MVNWSAISLSESDFCLWRVWKTIFIGSTVIDASRVESDEVVLSSNGGVQSSTTNKDCIDAGPSWSSWIEENVLGIVWRIYCIFLDIGNRCSPEAPCSSQWQLVDRIKLYQVHLLLSVRM